MSSAHLWGMPSAKRALTAVDGPVRFLGDRWSPALDGTDLHQAATMIGLDVVQKGGSVAVLLAALVAAAEEAGILDPSGAPVGPPGKSRRRGN